MEDVPIRLIKSAASLLTLEELSKLDILQEDQLIKDFLIDLVLDHLTSDGQDLDPIHDFINEFTWTLDDERLLAWSMENRFAISDYICDRFASEIANNAPGSI